MNTTLHKISLVPSVASFFLISQDEKGLMCNYHSILSSNSKNNSTDINTFKYRKSTSKFTGFEFPGSQKMNLYALKESFKFKTSLLLKDDLNGYFLNDQPGQPFVMDPGNEPGCFGGQVNILKK